MQPSEKELALIRQRRTLAEFGELALISPDLDTVLDSACIGVGDALGTHLAKFMQLDQEKGQLLLRNGVGWTPGLVGQHRVELKQGTPEWHTLSVNHPVISSSTSLETRFRLHPFQIENRVNAFVNVIVYSPSSHAPLGIFEVDSRDPRAFSETDVDFLRSYASLIAGCFERFRITDALKETETKLRESERQYRMAVELHPQIPWKADPKGTITFLDHRWEAFSGLLHEQTMGQGWRASTHPDDMPVIIEQWSKAVASLKPFDAQVRLRKTSGTYDWYQVRAYPDLDDAGLCKQWYGTVEDISERIRLETALREWNDNLEERISQRTRELQDEQREREAAETKLRQSQKMEAVGQLTGGIAHDFNNLLGGISASLELMQLRIDAGRIAEVSKYQTLALTSVKRAAALTARLLAFSRLQPLDPKVVDPNEVIAGLEDMIGRTMGPTIDVKCSLTHSGNINCDLNQLENALLNLAINARDAMPSGGCLTIQTRRLEVDERTADDKDLKPGPYSLISVTDDGSGMDEEVLRRAFDPFFTTKKIGQGTGLGLSMIYGFAQQSGGQIRIHSTVGIGTTVTLYFPIDERGIERALGTGIDALPDANGNGEVILVVDDESGVREIAVELLSERGYTVFEAIDSTSAFSQSKKLDTLDLLITDIGLPGAMNGLELARQMKAERGDLKILFITGYAKAEGISEGMQLGKVLSKPFSLTELAHSVSTALTIPNSADMLD
ncbi:response regulator [Pseudomonas sp. CDFA 602]|uniref:response regulator n=1 Tax=Pseudomonas californiensis TaxID=2829823 RepID=UPI001E435CB8|nr:response regulator [Pseudomonas californiensis]MCD5995456.1 response regulator [Pseudomonas californiensis]MCD6000948.1 response regulator [Pseudomonas californiensis]